MNCSITRAGATASSLEVANAVGPSNAQRNLQDSIRLQQCESKYF